MIFFLKSVNVLNYIRFSNIELSLHSCFKSNLIIVIVFYLHYFIWFCLRILQFYSWIKNLKVTLLLMSEWFWYQDDSVCVKWLGSLFPVFILPGNYCIRQIIFFSFEVWKNFWVKTSEPCCFYCWNILKYCFDFFKEL